MSATTTVANPSELLESPSTPGAGNNSKDSIFRASVNAPLAPERPGRQDDWSISPSLANQQQAWSPEDASTDLYEEIPIEPEISVERTQIFIASKKWEGTVVNVDESSFTARLKGLSPDALDEDEGEFPISDVTEDDFPLLVSGSPFYFSVGYRINSAGSTERTSRIRFKRLPKWTADDVILARTEAEEISKRLNPHADDSSETN